MGKSRTVTVLSIDGGGIRGVIPALVLAEIERRTEKPIASLFDLMAGSSTGGLLALALAKPDEHGNPAISAADLPDLYERYGRGIFSRNRWDAILSMDNWRYRRYPDTGIADVLTTVFEDADLRAALTDVIVTSYDIERRQPWFFRSSRACNEDRCNFMMRDVVRATTAAPTFFEPARVPNHEDTEDPFSLIDGSMTSINPTLCAYVEARETHPDATDFVVVSLGTGNLTQPLPYNDVRSWGLLNWVRPLSDIMFDASSRTVDYQMKRLVPRAEDGTNRYFRLQKRIDGIDHRMDDVSEVSLALIREWGAELIAENDAEIDMMCDQLLAAYDEKHPPERERFFSLRSLAFWRNNNPEDAPSPEDDQTTEPEAQTG
ncbi:MAG: patatin-like phospholipase family protein [Chloroflexota bacterium]